jgi:hypothetical protein
LKTDTYSEDEGKAKAVESLTLPATGPETVSEAYCPEGFESREAYLSDLRQDYEADVDFDHDNREEALDDKNFAAGNQWDPIVLEQRKGLPCLVINSIPQFTAQVVGDWRTNRNGIKVLPSENGDVDVAAVRGDLIRAIETKSRASRVYDSAFESMIQCGDGAYRIAVEYAREDVFDQDIFIRPIEDALSVVWDRMSVDPTGRDATHCFVDDTLPKKEYNKRWDEAIDPSTLSESFRRSLCSAGWITESSDFVRVTEHWRMVERTRLLGLFADGSVHALEGDKIDELYEKHGQPTKTRMAPCLYAQMHLVTGFDILAGPFEYRLNRLPIIRMSGRVINIEGKRVRHGIVRSMKDVVRLKNFWRSVNAEQLGYAPKAQWLATESAVEGKEDAIRRAHLSRDPLLVVNDEAVIGSTIQRIEPPQIQMALVQESAQNTQDMKDVTGIHDASLGIKSNETSGRAIMARQREGDIANLTYHDNGNAAILEGGDVINQLIPQIIDGTRAVRIIGQDEEAKFVRVNDPMDPNSVDLSIGNYDVTLDSGASYMTKRVEAAQSMMDAIQVFPEMMQIAGDLVVKAQDWPGAQEISERLKKAIPPQFLDEGDGGGQPQAQGIPPEAMQQAQEQMQKMGEQLQKIEVENATLKADQANKDRELDIKAYAAVTERLQIMATTGIDAHQMAIDADQAEQEFAHEADMNEKQFKHEVEQANKPEPQPKN